MRQELLHLLQTSAGINDAANKISKGLSYVNLKQWVLDQSTPLRAYDKVTWAERFYFIENNYTDRPTCKCCDNKVKYDKRNNKYRTYCSNKCTSIGGYNKRVQSIRVTYAQSASDILVKKQATCISKYGVDNPMKALGVQEKQRHATKNSMGVEYALQSDRGQQRRRDTLIEKYGTDRISSLPEIQEKVRNTMRENFNVDYAFQLPHVKQARFEAGYYGRSVSKISQELFDAVYDKLTEEDKTHCYYATRNKEFGLMLDVAGKSGYYYDFVLTTKRVCIEYNGDFWHANPDDFCSEDVVHSTLTAAEIWKKDDHKIKTIEERGYRVLTVWDSWYRQDTDQVLQYIMEEIYGE